VAEFTVQDGLFWLDGEPLILQAGEFHYFRTPREEWAHRLGLLKQAGFHAVASYIPWLWHEPAEGEWDFDGHTHPQRDLSGFLDLAAEMGLWIIARPGPYIMAETNREGIPQWVFEQYPQVAFIDQYGQPQNIASYLHPDFRKCVSGWYRAVFGVLTPRQVTRGGHILLIQLDNEMGMIPWVRNILDLNPDTLARFADHLRRTWGERLPERYPADQLEGLLRAGLVDAAHPLARQVVEDYRRFYRHYLREYAAFLLAEARANGLEVSPVFNIHGFANGGKTFPIGLSQLVEVMRLPDVVSATDVYPMTIGEGNFHQLLLINEMTRSLQNPCQPLFSIEFQAGGNQDFSGASSSFYDLHARLSISVGMRAINHYLFFDGENDPLLSPVRRHDWGHPVRKDGTLRSHYFRYPQLSAALQSYGPSLSLARPQTVTAVGFILDYFMTEVNTPATQEQTRILTHQREVILFDFIARGLALTHRPFRGLDLQRSDLDPNRTPSLWVMMERMCDAEIQARLVEYMRRGGRLILVGRMCLEDMDHRPCTILRDALELTHIQSDPPFTATEIDAFQYRHIPASFVETYQGDFDEVFATRRGETVGFIRRLGRGQGMVLGAAFPANTLEELDVFHRMAQKMDCPPLFQTDHWADVRISQGPNGSFVFINNYRDDPLETDIVYGGDRHLFAGHPVTLPARSGAILPLDWQPVPGVIVHFLTAEVRRIERTDSGLTLHLAAPEFWAELSLTGYRCVTGDIVEHTPDGRVRLHDRTGRIILVRLTPGLAQQLPLEEQGLPER